MASPYQLQALIAWSRRAEWRAPFGACFKRHVGKACDGAGIEPDEIGREVGEYADVAAWGAAFEDLLASDLADGRNLADEYLRHRAWKESVATRDYIAGLRRSVISLYEVSDVSPGESILLRDLVRGGEPVRVIEKSGSRSLRQWDRIATRVIALRSATVISGVLMHFDHETSEVLLHSLRRPGSKAPREVASAARKLGVTADEQALKASFTSELPLAQSAFLFTNLWLDAQLKAVEGPVRPTVVNSDGDLLELVTVHFPLLPGVTVERAGRALAVMPALRQETATFWNWVAAPGTGPVKPIQRPEAQQLITTMDDSVLVLGAIEIKGKRVSLSVNSEARAALGRAMLEGALVGLIRPPIVERTDLDQLLTEQRDRPLPSSGLLPEQERAVIQQGLDDHYRRVLDQPIPALGNRSPRAAVRTAKGREKVAAWLKVLENHAARPDPDDPIGSYDFVWMWRELGIEGLRR